ncbi:outer membrane beta-barrel family protein [Cytophagaceae bacterium YF14B1]|uniref:Outer membrane beta-barrel family protein n=1 Tax=Xanthocytophaga flava TaxID=3048013 RepID=A0AAE3QZD3_9BACT|nr:outer membrane beta-barrel family protein [Xanthocytophaga flavus]MDJ1485529.1 outer membrane beta-barrel family protein [Xanthocytophaga flavus]
MKSFLYTLFLFCLIYANAYSQNKSNLKIKGKIVDASNNLPVEFAAVALTDQLTNKVVNGTVTGTTGDFEIVVATAGTFMISVDFIGYQKAVVKDIVLNTTGKDLQTIQLTPSVNVLNEVTVVGKKAIVENKIDKIVYNAANDITSQGGVALDVLRKVPQVSVDIDGNVELQGNPNVRFLINGKPSTIFGNSLTDALASIPASQIQTIEVLTSPGARYDAQGTGGIINIVLKENHLQGMNGTISLTAGTRLENGSVNLNFRKNNFGINAFVSGNKQLSSRTPSSQNRFSKGDTEQTTQLLQKGYQDFQRSGYQSGIGFDWSPTKKDNLIGSIGYTDFGSESSGTTQLDESVFNTNGSLLSSENILRNATSKGSVGALEWSLSYSKKLRKDGQELNVLYSSSFGRPQNNYSQTQQYMAENIPYSGSSGHTPGNNKQTNLSIDYSHPLTTDFTLETGVKTVLQDINSQADVLVFSPSLNQYIADSSQSYLLNYSMKIYAGYLSGTFSLFHYLNVKAGLRFEHTDVTIDFPNTSIPSYNNLVPSIVLSHNFKDDQYLKLAFTRRIERADYREINPFMNLSDPYNITTGNPLLKPEIGNNIELGYNKPFKNGGSLYIALIERINTNDIKPYTTFYPEYVIGDSIYQNVSITKRQNIGIEYNSGISISGQLPLTTQLSIRGNAMVTQKRVVNTLLSNQVANGVNYRLNLNVIYQLPWDLVMEGFGNFSSAINTIQGKRPQQLTYNLAIRKQFHHKNASFGLTATNPFTRYIRQVTTVVTENYVSTTIVQVPYRSFGISLTYKFGKLEFKKDKESKSNFLQNAPSTDN